MIYAVSNFILIAVGILATWIVIKLYKIGFLDQLHTMVFLYFVGLAYFGVTVIINIVVSLLIREYTYVLYSLMPLIVPILFFAIWKLGSTKYSIIFDKTIGKIPTILDKI